MEHDARVVGLIGFKNDSAEYLIDSLARCGYKVVRADSASTLREQFPAIFVSADNPGWLETICDIRVARSRTLLIVATREPDYAKWLDALEAGAHDYFCTSGDPGQLGWLLRREAPLQREKVLSVAGAA